MRQEIHGSTQSVATEVEKVGSRIRIFLEESWNKTQFNFNAELLDNLKQTDWAIENNTFSYAEEVETETVDKIKQRNKLTELADS